MKEDTLNLNITVQNVPVYHSTYFTDTHRSYLQYVPESVYMKMNGSTWTNVVGDLYMFDNRYLRL